MMNPKPIRLVHIMTVPYSFTFIKGQVGYMKAQGFEVYGLSSPGELLSRFSENEGIPVHEVEMTKRITPIRDIIALVKIWRWLRRVQPDIVHAHTPKGGFLGMLGAWLARVPVRIYHVRGLRFVTTTGWKRKLLMQIEKWSCRFAQEVVCVSASVRTQAVDFGLCPAGKIKVLGGGSGNGVDSTNRFNLSKLEASSRVQTRSKYDIPVDAIVLGFVGRIVWSKGIVELSEAWCSLREEFQSLHLLMVGGAEAEDPIPTQVDQLLRGDPRVHLIGEEWNTPPLYAAMDMVVLPTYREGFPNVLLEAAAMSLPVVATSVPGCVDAVKDGVTGTLVPPYDSQKLAGAIRSYLKDPELKRRHGSAARERVVCEFRQETIWHALHQEYIQCLLREKLEPPLSRPIYGGHV
ncbi:MAG TPA: glycosyltransferase family 4 protein [Nitrospiraceae bacterium]|nr:glycosyltransferase family 4 protein [Nitrospiraceae bacterium]